MALEDPDEGPEQKGATPAEVAQRWISEIDIAEKDSSSWFKRGRLIIKRYKDERTIQGAGVVQDQRRFSVLWSNVQTLSPAVYGKTPDAVVSRRFKDEDPLARTVSEVLERAINYSVEEYDFDGTMKNDVLDYLLVGRGQAWVRYVPHMRTVPAEVTDNAQQEPYEELAYEEVCEDHVAWDNFLTNPCREWKEVRWCGRMAYLDRDALIERFGDEIGKQIPLDWVPKDSRRKGDTQFHKAVIYEIWDKSSKTVYWISKGFSAKPLDRREDPLGLKDFFPCPRPAYATLGPDSLIPIPDYVLYQDQAEELDELTARIGKLTDALRMVGFYAGEAKTEVQRVFAPGNENKLIPIESWAQFAGNGGVKGLVEWVPVDMVAQTLKSCFETRAQILDDIYHITGISDILRGDTDPDETLGAQKIKSSWGALRIRDRQKEIARFARDIMRIKGEIIANKFSVDTLKAMTGVKLMTNAEKQQVQQQIALQQQAYQMQMAQFQATQQQQPPVQQGMPPAAPMTPPPQPPKPPQAVQDMLGRPSWEDVDGVLKDTPMRQFRIEIETDSTVEPDEAEQKQAATEFIAAVGQYLANSLPVVQAAPQMVPVVMEGLKWLVRRYRVGREMEEVIDRAADQVMQAAQNPTPQPTDPTAAAKAQNDKQANQLKAAQLQLDAKGQQVDAAERQAALQTEQQRTQLQAQGQAHGQLLDEKSLMAQTVLKAEELTLKREILNKPDPPKAK